MGRPNYCVRRNLHRFGGEWTQIQLQCLQIQAVRAFRRTLNRIFMKFIVFIFTVCVCTLWPYTPVVQGQLNFTAGDVDLINVALNLEYFEAEFFLFGAFGYGLDKVAPTLAAGGPSPLGGQKAKLDAEVESIVIQLGLQEVGHLRAIKGAIGKSAFPRIQLDISSKVWAKVFDNAFGKALNPPFNPYSSGLNYILASYVIPYVGLTGYTGASADLVGEGAKSLVARLLAVEAGQDAVIRTWLYQHRYIRVYPYKHTVAEFTNALSNLRNKLDHGDLDDEGLIVTKSIGAEGQVTNNILAGDIDSIAYTRTPKQIFEVVYGTGNASKPGGFFPKGGDGKYAKSYLGVAVLNGEMNPL